MVSRGYVSIFQFLLQLARHAFIIAGYLVYRRSYKRAIKRNALIVYKRLY
jgi:hypothetical protein